MIPPDSIFLEVSNLTNHDDMDELDRWVKIMNKSHGYGGVFNRETPEDKAIVELSTASEWRISIETEFGLSVDLPESNPDDPPDCYVKYEGRRLSVELVQLIERKHKQRATQGESPYAGQLFTDTQWTIARFGAALNKIIEKKGTNYKNREILIDVLVIHTDEPWLNSKQAHEWLEEIKIQNHPSISSAFLLFNYEPDRGTQHWPVFRLYGHLPTSAKDR